MKKPWTLRLVAIDVKARIAYTGPQPRFWTRRAAAKVTRRMNAATRNRIYLWFPAFTRKDPW